MPKMSSNSTFGSKMSLIRPSKGGGVGYGRTGGLADGRTGRQPGLGGCRGLILDPNDDYEDDLEVLMKCRYRKCPQT